MLGTSLQEIIIEWARYQNKGLHDRNWRALIIVKPFHIHYALHFSLDILHYLVIKCDMTINC